MQFGYVTFKNKMLVENSMHIGFVLATQSHTTVDYVKLLHLNWFHKVS